MRSGRRCARSSRGSRPRAGSAVPGCRSSRSRGRRRRAACGSSHRSPPPGAPARRARARAPRRASGSRGPRAARSRTPGSRRGRRARRLHGVTHPGSSCRRRATHPRARRPACRSRSPSRARSREPRQRSPGSSQYPFIDQVGPHDLVVRYVCRLGPGLDPHRPFSGRKHLAFRSAGHRLHAHAPTRRPARSARASAGDGRSRATRPRRCTRRGTNGALRSPVRRARGRHPLGGRRRRRSAPCRSARARVPRRRGARTRRSGRPRVEAGVPSRAVRLPLAKSPP